MGAVGHCPALVLQSVLAFYMFLHGFLGGLGFRGLVIGFLQGLAGMLNGCFSVQGLGSRV